MNKLTLASSRFVTLPLQSGSATSHKSLQKYARYYLAGLASAAVLMVGATNVPAALPILPPGDNTENIVFQEDFADSNLRGWTNIAPGTGKATIGVDPAFSTVKAWYPSINDGTGMSSDVILPSSLNLANGPIAIYMRVRVDGGNAAPDGNRFGVTLTESTTNRYGSLVIRPGDKASVGYRNAAGTGLPLAANGLVYSFPTATYQDFRLVLTNTSPGGALMGDYLKLEAYAYNTTTATYEPRGTVVGANILTGIFNKLNVMSRNGNVPSALRGYFDSVMITQVGGPRASYPSNAYLVPVGGDIQTALNGNSAVVLSPGDYSGQATLTLRSGKRLYGDQAGTMIPSVIVEAGTTGAVLSNVILGPSGSGSLTFPASTLETKGNVFDHLLGKVAVTGATMKDNLFLSMDGPMDINTTAGGYVRNNRFIRTKSHGWSNQLVMLGDAARSSYGNVFLWKNFLTPAGDATNINNQGDLTFIGVDAESWNYSGTGTGASLWKVGTMGTLRIFGMNGGTGSSSKTGIFDVNADEFQLYNDSMSAIGNEHPSGDFSIDFESPSYALNSTYSAAANTGTLPRSGPAPALITNLNPGAGTGKAWTATVKAGGATGNRLVFSNTATGTISGTLEAFAPPPTGGNARTWFAQMDYTRLTTGAGPLLAMRLVNSSGQSMLGHQNNVVVYADGWEGVSFAVGTTYTLRLEIDMSSYLGMSTYRTYLNGVLKNTWSTSSTPVTNFGGLQLGAIFSTSFGAGDVFALDNIRVGTLVDYKLGANNLRSLLVYSSTPSKYWTNAASNPFRLKAFDGGGTDVATSISSGDVPTWTPRTGALPTSAPDQQAILRAMVVNPVRLGQAEWEAPRHAPIPDPAGSGWATGRGSMPDSKASLQAIITAGGKIPAGIYYIGGSLKIKRDQCLIGSGADVTAIIAKDSSFDMIVADDVNNPTQGDARKITIADITLQGGKNGLHLEPVGTGTTQADGITPIWTGRYDGSTPPKQYVSRAQYTSCYINHVTFRNMVGSAPGTDGAGIFMDRIYALDNIFFGYVHFVNCDTAVKQRIDDGYKIKGGDAADDPFAARMMYMDKVMFYKCQFVGNWLALDLLGYRGCNLNAWVSCLFQDNSQGAAVMTSYLTSVFANCDFRNNGGVAVVKSNYTVNHVSNAFIAGASGVAMFDGPVSAEGCVFDRTGSTTANILSGSNSRVFLSNSSTANMPIGLPTGTAANGMLLNTMLGADSSALNQQGVSIKAGAINTILPGAPVPAPAQMLFGSDWSTSIWPIKDY